MATVHRRSRPSAVAKIDSDAIPNSTLGLVLSARLAHSSRLALQIERIEGVLTRAYGPSTGLQSKATEAVEPCGLAAHLQGADEHHTGLLDRLDNLIEMLQHLA